MVNKTTLELVVSVLNDMNAKFMISIDGEVYTDNIKPVKAVIVRPILFNEPEETKGALMQETKPLIPKESVQPAKRTTRVQTKPHIKRYAWSKLKDLKTKIENLKVGESVNITLAETFPEAPLKDLQAALVNIGDRVFGKGCIRSHGLPDRSGATATRKA